MRQAPACKEEKRDRGGKGQLFMVSQRGRTGGGENARSFFGEQSAGNRQE